LGELQAPTISIDSGVVFNGSCSMESHKAKTNKTN
jgi:cytoskeletal protein CcmA (bactofilin family)